MNTYPSLALAPEITMSSGLAPAGPKPGKKRKLADARCIDVYNSYTDVAQKREMLT